jgi:hypothetical protein
MSFCVRFVVDSVALGQGLDEFLFSSISIIPPWLTILVYYLGHEQYARLCPQFRDTVLLHRREHKHEHWIRISVRLLLIMADRLILVAFLRISKNVPQSVTDL